MKKKKILLTAAITAVFAAVFAYITMPPINLRSTYFWFYLIVTIGFCCVVWVVLNIRNLGVLKDVKKFAFTELGVIIACVILTASGAIVFHSDKYANLLNRTGGITEYDVEDFRTDFPEDYALDKIALMDNEGAKTISARQLGSLKDFVSQYQNSDSYATFNYNGSPMKVGALRHAGFLQYLRNKTVPGYILVDPVNQTAEYVGTEGMKYTDSAYFSKNIQRHVYLSYPTLLLGRAKFEIDDEGNPFYITPILKRTIGFFGGTVISGCIVTDPCTGENQRYDIENVPEWIDQIFDGNLLNTLYNYHGRYRNGYFNFSNVGKVKTTDDFGYISWNNDIWVFTGVTSYVENEQDESNIGFIMMNQRTAETRFYSIYGAEEYSAMSAAEGRVANYGYRASFPALANINGEATYVMILHDNAYLTKGYALVNMQNYSIVAFGTTRHDAINNYLRLIGRDTAPTTPSQPVDPEEQLSYSPVTVTVSAVSTAVIDGDTYYYLIVSGQEGENLTAYELKFSDNKEVMFISAGDTVTLYAADRVGNIKPARLQ